jgi:predicted nucleic acid binding AN1-type Zn finger protein
MKCTHCKKKVPAVSFTCVGCGALHCVACRLPEVHACPVKVVKEVLLPVVIAPKLERI